MRAGAADHPSTPPPRPWRSDSGAASAEGTATRRSLAEGRVTLAPRVDGWVVVTLAPDGQLEETPVLGRDGRQVQAWDDAGLSRWVADREPRRAPSPLARLLRRLGF